MYGLKIKRASDEIAKVRGILSHWMKNIIKILNSHILKTLEKIQLKSYLIGNTITKLGTLESYIKLIKVTRHEACYIIISGFATQLKDI